MNRRTNGRTILATTSVVIFTLGSSLAATAAVTGNLPFQTGSDQTTSTVVELPTSSTASTAPTSTRITTAGPTSSIDDRGAGRDDGSTTSTVSSGKSSTSSSSSTIAPTGNAATTGQRTITDAAGSIDIAWTSRALSLLAVRPAVGFTARSEASSDEVEVKFTSGSRETEIKIRLVNGEPVVTTESHAEDH